MPVLAAKYAASSAAGSAANREMVSFFGPSFCFQKYQGGVLCFFVFFFFAFVVLVRA